MRRTLRTLVWTSAAVFAVLVVVTLALALVVGAVSHGWQRERVRALLETTLSSALADAGLPARIRLGALDGPLYPDATLRDLALELDGAAPIRVRAVRVRLDLGELLQRRLVIVESLGIEGATLSASRDPERGWPWETWPSPTEAAAERAIAVELRDVSLSDSRVEFDAPGSEAATRLAGSIAATLSRVEFPRSGPPGWPERAEISLQLEPGVVAGRALHRAEVELRLAGSHLELVPSSLDSEFGRARVEGSTDLAGWLDPSMPASFRVSGFAEELDLGVLLARPGLEGAFCGTLELEASHRSGEPLLRSRGEATIRLAPSRIGALRIETGELRGRFADGSWELFAVTFESDSAALRASGSGDLERMTAFDLELDVTDLHALASIAGHDVGGSARVSGKLEGAFRDPTGSVEIDVRDLRLADRQIGAFRTRITSAGRDRFRLDPFVVDGQFVKLENDGPIEAHREADRIVLERAGLILPEVRSLLLSGQLDASGTHELRVEIDALDLERLSARLDAPLPVGGLLTGTFVSKGALPRPELRGDAVWTGPELEKISASPLAISFETGAGSLRADARLSSGGRDLLVGTLRAPWIPGIDLLEILESPKMFASVSGEDLDLAQIASFFPEALRPVEGRAQVRIEAQGGRPDSRLEGELRVTRALIDLPTLGQRVGPLDAKLRFSRDAVHVEELRIESEGGGHATLTGEVLLADLLPLGVDLRIDAHAYPVRRGTSLRGNLDGSVTLVGPFDSLVANGDLTLRDLHYSLARETHPLLGEISVRRGVPPARRAETETSEIPRFYEQASLDLRVDVPPGGRVTGDGADAVVGGRLRARKFPGRSIGVLGRIETLSGSYRLRGKTFIVEHGAADFSGRADLDPDLDLRARYRVRQISIFALIGGRASAPTLRLESDPPYPEHDVLALLLFGRTRQELDSAQASALQSVLTETAGGAALAELTERLAIPLPVDSLDVKTSESTSTPTIGVGRYLTEDIYVHYGQDIGGNGDSDVRVDWNFAPRWTIESGASSRGDSHVDLIWTYDY